MWLSCDQHTNEAHRNCRVCIDTGKDLNKGENRENEIHVDGSVDTLNDNDSINLELFFADL